MIEEPTKKYKGETDDLQSPDSLQPDQQASDTEQQGQRQSGSQQPDPQLVDPNMSSNGNSDAAPSASIPLTELKEPARESRDSEANEGTQRKQLTTDGENDGANVIQDTVV